MEMAARAGLYLHVPICRQKCRYCSFYSFVPGGGEIRDYLAAVRLQMRQLAALAEVRELTFATVFFGGGTPSILSVEELAGLLADCRQLFTFTHEEPEISIEVNPGTVDAAGLGQLRQAGFNRLSIGVQSFADKALRELGRIHTAAEARALAISARRAGFDNLNLDLMYGLPGQRVEDWRRTLDQALALAPEHLSMYELTVEEGTPFWRQTQQDQLALPGEDEALAMMADIDETLAGGGMSRYEISNYAVPGRQCRHNLNYWHNGCYLGLGPGAVSALGSSRRAATADLVAYCQRVRAGAEVWDSVERLDHEAAFRETVVMGLRMIAGVSIAALLGRFGIDLAGYYGPTLHRLVDLDLLSLEGDHLRLTARGLPLANRVMAELV